MFFQSDPFLRYLLATLLILIAGCVITAIYVIRDIRNFRREIKPGDYARVKTLKGVVRCKYLQKTEDNLHLFKAVDSKQIILTIPENIYLP